ncbi:MAG: class I SAM-dependent rRNA methyltransferase, partial [Polyangiaceae bacterium]
LPELAREEPGDRLPTVVVKAGHVQPIWAGHPWVYAQAIERIDGEAAPGAEVRVVDRRGQRLGRGLYSPSSAIRVRLFATDVSDVSFDEHLGRALERARLRRRAWQLPSSDTDAYRLVYAEGDELPGLVIDVYGDVCAVQLGTVGMHERRERIVQALVAELAPRAIIDRTSVEAARREGFVAGQGVIHGDAELAELRFRERGLEFAIPLALGQKTGFYLDQRVLRARVEQLARGRRVLDCYTYVGAVALSAARGGASYVRAIDKSEAAIAVARACAAGNGLTQLEFHAQDAFEALRSVRADERFDLVICDPPKLAPKRSAAPKAVQLMQRLARAASEATNPGGLVLLSSCSAALGLNELTRAAALGAREVGVRLTIVERLFQGPDHPVPAAFPEGSYLSSVLFEATRA